MFSRCLAVLLFLGVSTGIFGQTLEQELASQGFKYYEMKDYAGAADYLGQVVDMNPGNDQIRFYLVYSLFFSGNHDLALKHANHLSKKYPDNQQYSILVKQIEKEISKLAQKKQELIAKSKIPQEVIFGGYQSMDVMREPRVSTETREITKPKVKTPLDEAIAKMDEELFDEARVLLKKIIAGDNKNAMAWHQLGVIDFTFGKYNAAIKNFSKALEISPKHFQSNFLLADSYRQIGDFRKAEAEFSKSLNIQQDIFAQLNLADVKIKLGKITEAEKIYTDLVDKNDNLSDAKAGLANIKFMQGENREALEIVNSALRGGKGSSEIRYIKALLMAENRLYNEAAGEMADILKDSSNNYKYRAFQAYCMLMNYDIQNAIKIATEILEKRPDNAEAKLVLAEALIISGSYRDAADQITSAEKTSKSPKAAQLIAQIAEKQNSNDEARTHYMEYVARSNGQPKPLYEYAQFLERIKANRDAITVYEELIKKYPKADYTKNAKTAIELLKSSGMNSEKKQSSGSAPNADPNIRPGSMKY
ncbi:MAG: tetratricopeptide repeat protein [Candidatus Riflebacteria bacterium]|nr:tetratricopeptide repeat protein [Candidatus Riflebacteria bacterium]